MSNYIIVEWKHLTLWGGKANTVIIQIREGALSEELKSNAKWGCCVESGREWETRPLGEHCLLKRSGPYGEHMSQDHITRCSRVRLKLCQQQRLTNCASSYHLISAQMDGWKHPGRNLSQTCISKDLQLRHSLGLRQLTEQHCFIKLLSENAFWIWEKSISGHILQVRIRRRYRQLFMLSVSKVAARAQILPPRGHVKSIKKMKGLSMNPKNPPGTSLSTRSLCLLCADFLLPPPIKKGAHGAMLCVIYWDPHAAPVWICTGHIRCQSQYSFGSPGMLLPRHWGHGSGDSADWANFTHASTAQPQTACLTCNYLLKCG